MDSSVDVIFRVLSVSRTIEQIAFITNRIALIPRYFLYVVRMF